MERIPVTPAWACARLVRRAPDSHKGTYGKVLAVCGCERYRGVKTFSLIYCFNAPQMSNFICYFCSINIQKISNFVQKCEQ